MSEVFDRKEFIAGYLVEAEEHLRAANTHLLAIESTLHKNEPHPARVRELFRALHTLKGLSAMVGADPIVEVAHEMEAILRMADQSTGRLSFAAVELLLNGVRAIEVRVSALAAGAVIPPAPAELLAALSTLQPAASFVTPGKTRQLGLEPQVLAKLSSAEQQQLIEAGGRGRRAIRVDYVPSPARTAAGISITTVRERVSLVGEIVKVIPIAVPKNDQAPGALAFVLLVLVEASQLEQLAEAAFTSSGELQSIDIAPEQLAEPAAEDDAIGDAPLQTSSIRVDVERLDDAMEKLAALVVTRFRLSRAVSALRDDGVDVRELTAIVNENARQLRDLRSCITRARMVPVRELLERVPLIVRGMSRSTGKAVRLVIQAGTAELDKAVAERVFPAIVHLVRNAVDHAIEAPAERLARGKAEEGQVTVSCFEHSNSELELRVEDDGRGIDAAEIARKAGRDTLPTNSELLELITLPGFSTAPRITSSSGRGMGMEIVKRIAVATLGGRLALETTPGRGTTFTLRIPLSISIVDSFAFACGEQAFVVPVSMVDEIIEVDWERALTPPTPSGGRAPVKIVERRGAAVPVVSLASLFSLPASQTRPGKALVVRQAGERFAFAVDRMLGQQEIVVRPLEDPLVKVAGVSGSTDLGDGKPTLVLDLLGLVGLEARNVRAPSA